MQRLRQQPATLVIMGLLVAGIAHGLVELLSLASAHWAEPNLFGDSFAFVQRGTSIGNWLTAQHNEHRIVWAKAATLVETELLRIPPGQSALFQNLALILGSAGLWSALCQRLLKRNDLRLITALSGLLILLNPWQYENFSWEFQTPWFLINSLVLLSSVLLSAPSSGSLFSIILAALVPWIALASTGQGLALAVAFTICSLLHSRKLGAVVMTSTASAGLVFFALLPYSKPLDHPELGFRFEYFLRAWLGGPWQGLSLLCLIIATVMIKRYEVISRKKWAAILVPGLFSTLFAGMITLSRSGFSIEQANSSRYVTHSLLLALTAILALAVADDQQNNRSTHLLGAALVLISTIGSFPQGLKNMEWS
jgi:hypothetical protein